MKYARKLTAALLTISLLLIHADAVCPPVSAEHALVMDAASGTILCEKNAEERCLIASTTKIMTGLLVAEDCDLSQWITIPPEAAGIEGSSVCLKPGEAMTVEDLLYGLMLQSGNDAAVALAVIHSGSVQAFVDAMNRRAQELGLSDTHYANPNGLDDDGNYSTARDLARLSACAMENETFRTVVSTRDYRFGSRCLRNHNKLLWQYDGAEGVKTGYTKAAGRILVSSASRNGRRLLAVTISAPDDWNDHRTLLDMGFSSFSMQQVCRKDQVLGTVHVCGGNVSTACVCAQKDMSVLLLPGESVRTVLTMPAQLNAPLRAGTVVGTAQFYLKSKELACCELILAADILPRTEQQTAS